MESRRKLESLTQTFRFTAFAELSVQNHLPGDAGHLTVSHCVGSVLLTLRSVLHAGLVLLCKEKRSPPVARVLPWKSWVVWDDLSRVLSTATGAVAGRGADPSSVVIMGGDERAG